jgi:hypothetical protein
LSHPAAGAGHRQVADDARPPAEPLAGVVFALLVVACLVAFFVTQRLKHTPTVVTEAHVLPVFAPIPSGHEKEEHIDFKLAHADSVTVEIVDSDDDPVAVLMRRHPVLRYRPFYLRWDGREGEARAFSRTSTPSGLPVLIPHNDGAPAPAGEYRVRVILHDERRELNLPRTFRLVRP